MRTTKIKLCGMMRECDIDFANEAKPDYVGFIFADTRRKITPEQAITFRTKLSDDIMAVGVFVNENVDVVANIANSNAIDIIQLHGNEDEKYISLLKSKINNKKIFKAVRVFSPQQIVNAAGLDVDALLLDAYRKGVPGGTGECFNWELINDAFKLAENKEKKGKICNKPYFMAGGIDITNYKEAMSLNPYGLDISSGIETDGKKDRTKMIELVRRIRNV